MRMLAFAPKRLFKRPLFQGIGLFLIINLLIIPGAANAAGWEFKMPDFGSLLGSGDSRAGVSEAKPEATEGLPRIQGSLSLEAVVSPVCREGVQGKDRDGVCCNQPLALLRKIQAENQRKAAPPSMNVYHCKVDHADPSEAIDFCSVQKLNSNCVSMQTPVAAAEATKGQTERIQMQGGVAVFPGSPPGAGPNVYQADIDKLREWQSENFLALSYFIEVLKLPSIQTGHTLQVDRELGLTLPAMSKPYGMGFKSPKDVIRCPKSGPAAEAPPIECNLDVQSCILPALQAVFALETYFRDKGVGEDAGGISVSIGSCSDGKQIEAFLQQLVKQEVESKKLIEVLSEFLDRYKISFINLKESLDMMSTRNGFELFGYDEVKQESYSIELGKSEQVREGSTVVSSLVFGSQDSDPDYSTDGLRAYLLEGLGENDSGATIRRD